MAYTWANSVGKQDEAIGFLKLGIEANPSRYVIRCFDSSASHKNSSSYLLNFAYVEALEIKKEFTEVHSVYDKFLAVLQANLDALEKANAAEQNGAAGGAAANGVPNASVANISVDQSSQNTSYSSSSSDDNPKVTELQKHRTEYGLAWNMYMRFARRAEGVKSSRTVFGKARKDRWTPWEVFEAAGESYGHISLWFN